MEFSFAVWGYGLAKEWNSVCSVGLWFGRWTRRAAKSIVFVSESLYIIVNWIMQQLSSSYRKLMIIMP